MMHSSRKSPAAAGLGPLVVLCLMLIPAAAAGEKQQPARHLSRWRAAGLCQPRQRDGDDRRSGHAHKSCTRFPSASIPRGSASSATQHRLAVAVYADDVVAILDADAGQDLGRIDVFDEPYGVVSDRAGGRCSSRSIIRGRSSRSTRPPARSCGRSRPVRSRAASPSRRRGDAAGHAVLRRLRFWRSTWPAAMSAASGRA
jgi:hypothetical protein